MAKTSALINKETLLHICNSKQVSSQYLVTKGRFNPERLTRWMDISDSLLPTILQAKKLASCLHIPFAGLYMNPLDIPLKKIPSFRNMRTLWGTSNSDDSALNIAIIDLLSERDFLLTTSLELGDTFPTFSAPFLSVGLYLPLEELEEAVNETRACRTLEPETVISALQAVGERLDRGELDPLILRYAGPGGRREVAHIRPLLRREALEYKLAVELGIPLYSFQERPFGRTQTVPLGTLFHVTAGNVDGLPAFSAVEGLLTGNINLVKLPSGDQGLSLAVFQLLTEQEPRLAPFLYAFQIPSRDTAALRRLADLADGAVVWGGDGAVTALRQLAPPGCKLMEWGHRLSFAYLSRWEGEEDALSALAEHLIQTGGLLCSSCQVIFLDTDALGEGDAFCRSFVPLLERAADRFRAALGEKGEGSLYAWETRLEHAADRLPRTLFPGRGCSLTLREDRELELSPLHGNVLVKCLPQKALLPVLRRQKGRLQTAGLLCPAQDRPALTQLLARAGVTRIAPPGSMSRTLSGEGHDGEFPLRRYVRTVDIQEPSPDRPI